MAFCRDIGCTSFFPSKNLACFGDGGAVYTNNYDLAKKIKMIANHGQPKKYIHDLIGMDQLVYQHTKENLLEGLNPEKKIIINYL